jgi:hypothetical protein
MGSWRVLVGQRGSHLKRIRASAPTELFHMDLETCTRSSAASRESAAPTRPPPSFMVGGGRPLLRSIDD